MSESFTEARSALKSIRITLAISGALALIAGLVLLIWPVKSAVIITGIFASYLIIAGLVYVGIGIFSGNKGWARIGHLVLGLLYIVAGVIAFTNLTAAAASLAIIVVIFIGISWIVDGVVSLTLLGQDGSRVWTLLYALLSVVAGIAVLTLGFAAVPLFWLLLAASLIALGIVQIVRAITLGKAA
ncbi:HdeD family acid-resistance protein [Microbacterium sp. LWH12-1.2]|uniref:HdeD family acid-resistance protein n=1 Tax=Microbacterium sp. LWH12-1.2 TaxID=3135259 RepID=UPI00341E88A2